ncbi:amino acid carrier protein [Thermanaerovibrio velox DSM 12556]|uniref:Amino acid carrier protein n=1 Tax=Thermanaerovibrio velox DSM 12556 TaxID=926567 RepID=H0UP40_9BACT|nr:sodium:alanine symporter family protein [Thermanaerovibrio velox]EHM10543.1 amino acid carrier protein [Thermanaerovibrio velox DSM 12556]
MDLLELVKTVNGVLWGYLLIFLLCGTGIFYTLRLGFVQVRLFRKAFRKAFGELNLFGKRADREGMSSFQALATAVAAQVGTGNLAGAATAIAMGGPGAIFWMYLAAFFGMATNLAEAVLGQIYKAKDDRGQVTGGPAYYISQGLNMRSLAAFFSISIIVALGFIGNMVQSNSIADAFHTAFHVPPIWIGIAVGAVGAFVFIGGIGRIASVTEKMVPLMAGIYILGSLYILATHIGAIPGAIRAILVGAFNPAAATGGLIGATIREAARYGIARGLFSNEAGMGSTPHAHAVAKVDHPVEQGLMGIVGVFIDTFVVLNMTAFVILCTGVLDGKTTGIALTQKAFTSALGSIGNPFVAVCLLFFAFSTIVGWYFFGEANVRYLFGSRGLPLYKAAVVGFIVLGSTLKVDLVWELADTFNGLMVFPNLLALIMLCPVVAKAVKEFESQGRE